jgi:hypothetical protein
MKVIMDRNLCNNSLSFCERCSAAFFRNPEGEDRLCILDVIEDGKDALTLEMYTDGRVIELELTEEDQELASVEGWEALADFDPALFRTGANARWHKIRMMETTHTI